MVKNPVVEDPEWASLFEPNQTEDEELAAMLGRLPVFDTLTNRELRRVERIIHRRRFGASEVVIPAWVPRSGLFVVERGSVDVVRQLPSGESIVIGSLGPGELLGEFAILDDSPRSTSIVASEPSDMIGFFRPDLMDLVETDPRLGFKILYRVSQIMSARLNEVVGGFRSARHSLSICDPEVPQ